MNMDSVAALVPAEIAELRYRPLFAFQIQVKGLSVIGATPGMTGALVKSAAGNSKASGCGAVFSRAAATGSRCVRTVRRQ